MNLLTENKYIFALLTLFLTMYGPKFAPKLPPYIVKFFSNWFFKGLIMFLVVYNSNKNLSTSLMVTAVFFGLHYISKKYLVIEKFIKHVPTAKCGNENKIKHKQGVFSKINPNEKPLYNTLKQN